MEREAGAELGGGVRIAYLADHPELLPVLLDWFRAEWPDYYGSRTVEDVLDELRAGMHRDCLPLRLVAFAGAEPAGTVILREHPLDARPNLRPGLGGLYVAPGWRRQGIGATLVSSCMGTAHALGHTELFAATGTARALLERLGWERTEELVAHGQEVTLYRRGLGGK
ncbi:MAG: putative N-acetyltransferase [Armatimonadetes bacterium]|jgi:predicted N-acetyltransferase YhbS|nr:putative N-acetyltransferase [Armatimonadota bacterium]